MEIVVQVLLLLVLFWELIIKVEPKYQTDLSSLLCLHVSALFVAILSWLLIKKCKNKVSDNLLLCKMALSKREKKSLSPEEAFRIEEIVLDFLGVMGEDAEDWKELGRRKIEDWSEKELEELALRKFAYDSEEDEKIDTKLNCLRCKLLIQSHEYKTLCEIKQTLKCKMDVSFWDDFKIIQFMNEVEDKYMQKKGREEELVKLIEGEGLRRRFFRNCQILLE